MRRTVAACRLFSLGLRPPVRPRARVGVEALAGALDDQLALELVDRAECRCPEFTARMSEVLCTARADATG